MKTTVIEQKDKKYKTQDFKVEVLCFFKDVSGGVYDIYIKNTCIAVGISENELLTLEKILKLNDTNSK